ncbi:hypothetical protein WJX72_006408 [[Myrmecia] bisecta]|uniref:Smr domain-containing protein n=1 Tax=[Myrmecia] bisecta TaxID=41462 RepID=A0AAW1QR64_9CHLO
MAAEVALQGGLKLGGSQSESEVLLEETAEALHANMDFDGVYDLRPLLAAVARGRVLQPLHLNGAGSGDSPAPQFPRLCFLGRGIRGAAPQLLRAIRHCIQGKDGRILDQASPRLAEVRAKRQANLQALRSGMEEWARKLHQQGVSERAQVVMRRGRSCVPVKVGRQGELPRGSVTLATSGSGSTVYMEPQPLVALNNSEALLAGQEAEEEQAVMVHLSRLVSGSSRNLKQLLKAIGALDAVNARAKHAEWMGACRPRFVTEGAALQCGCLSIPAARHPLLLEPCLPRLPEPPAAEVVDFDSTFDSPVGTVFPLEDSYSGWSSGGSSERDEEPSRQTATRRTSRPCPVDLRVPAAVTVATVTGPNTGGKTASLKTLGLMVLMAKAGLFLPLQAEPRLLWFDQVLADLGDGQSLQQSLSTFSGHIRRVRNILTAVTPRSLVLLDEVGSGTDPAEGVALAASVLHTLAGHARLTFATTHHAELKQMPAEDARYINASVEFDIATLRPTYRLLWGVAGFSNALAVAEGLGFDRSVVAEARQVAQHATVLGDSSKRAAALRESLAFELQEAESQAQAAAAARAKAEAQLQALEQEAARLAAEQDRLIKEGQSRVEESVSAVQAQVKQLLRSLEAGSLDKASAEQQLATIAGSAPNTMAATATLIGLRSDSGEYDGDGVDASLLGRTAGDTDWVPQTGETVQVLKMGGARGQVVQAGRAGGKLTVKVGSLTIQLRTSEVRPLSRQAKAAMSASLGAETKAMQLKFNSTDQSRKAARKGMELAASKSPVLIIQTAYNTADVRGMRGSEATAEVDFVLASVPGNSAVFVIHGVATGRLREEVRAFLKRHPSVERFEDEQDSAGGCTVVFLKQAT